MPRKARLVTSDESSSQDKFDDFDEKSDLELLLARQSPDQEVFYKTPFGAMRLDSKNKVKSHGQFDPDSEENLERSSDDVPSPSFSEVRKPDNVQEEKSEEYTSNPFLEKKPRDCDEIAPHFRAKQFKKGKSGFFPSAMPTKGRAQEQPEHSVSKTDNSKPLKVPQKKSPTALDFVRAMRVHQSRTSNCGEEEVLYKGTKEAEVLKIGVSLQKRLGDALGLSEGSNSKSKKRLALAENENEDLQEADGRLLEKFRPVNLHSLTSMEVENMLKDLVVIDKYDIFAINKPYGVSMWEPDEKRHSIEKFLPFLKSIADTEHLQPVHRLDKQTTGVLLFSKTPEAHDKLTRLFRERQVHKTYWAILNGTPDPSSGVINIPLGNTVLLDGRHRVTICPDYGKQKNLFSNKKSSNFSKSIKPAVTEYRTMARFDNASLIEATSFTGLKHQIRAHLGLALNTPILGDHKYSYVDEIGKPQRIHGDILKRLANLRKSQGRHLPIFLHAKKVAIDNFVDNDRQFWIEAPPPKFFLAVKKKLKLRREL